VEKRCNLNIIGLGAAGCNVADKFTQYPQYDVYKIDVGLKGLKKNGIYAMPRQQSVEDYESNCPSLKNFLKNVSGEVIFILCGAGAISGASLRILETIKNCEISILYILPDVDLLSELSQLRNNVTFNVLQQYARSGMFKAMRIVHNPSVEAIIGDVPVIGYYDRLNEVIASTMHMINVYKKTESVMDTFSQPVDFARISTIGIYNEKEKKESLLFSLDNIREIVYYYSIPNDVLKSDGNLLKGITKKVKQSSNAGEVKTSFGIFSTNYDQKYCFIEAHTSFIQNNKN